MSDDRSAAATRSHVSIVHEDLAKKLAAIDAKVDRPAQWVVDSRYTAIFIALAIIGAFAFGAWLF